MELFFHLHFVHRAVVATILTGIECAITFILVFLRVYGRSIGVLRLKIDFWLVSFALVRICLLPLRRDILTVINRSWQQSH